MLTYRGTLVALAALAVGTLVHVSPGYHLIDRYAIGGDGGWDYLAFDTVGHRLFVARETRISVIDPETGTLIGEVPGLVGAHGIAFADEFGHGFATSGRDSSVTIFDLETLRPVAKTTVAAGPDGILYDPASKRVFSFNGASHSASAIDAASGRALATIDLGADPEFAVSAGDGKLYVNLTDIGAVAEIDAHAMRVVRQWSIAPCQSPTGLAIDRVNHRLFSGCRSKVMAISNVTTGTLVTTLPIGGGVDAVVFDARTHDALSSNGDGTLTVVHEEGPDRYSVAETVETMSGARTMALDPRTHRAYLVSARFGSVPDQPTADNPRRRPPIVPGSFTLLVLGRR